MHPVMCGATGLVLVSTINSIVLSSLFAFSKQVELIAFGLFATTSMGQEATEVLIDACAGSGKMF